MAFGKEHKKKTINFIKLWDEIGTALVKQNDSNYGETRTYNSYVDLLGLYSGEDNVTYLFSIDGYPKRVENSYRTTLRGFCRAGVRISFISPLEKHRIDWNSPHIKAKLRTWKLIEQNTDEVDEYNLHQNLNSLDSQDWRKDSLVYLSSADLRRKRKMFKFRSLMLISGERGKDFDTSVRDIVDACKSLNIKISRVIGDIPEYLKAFSPFSNTWNRDVFDKCGCITIPDELLARFNTYAQGTIGKSGLYWGTDIYSCFPCLKPVKRTTEDAENWLVTAETGGGKSYFVKGLLVQLLSKPNFNGTIMDVEGFEYIPLAVYMTKFVEDSAIILNMAEGSGAYYDPVKIVLTGDEELDKDMYSLSTSFTLSLFKCLLGGIQEEDEWTDIVINDAVSLTYGKAGVDAEDPTTWRNADYLTVYDVYRTLKDLKSNSEDGRSISSNQAISALREKQGYDDRLATNDVARMVTSNLGYQKAIDMCIAKLSRYFEENGIRSSLFKNRIRIEDVKDAKLVICSFGMAGKTEKTVDSIQMSLMQLYSANISHLRSIFSKNAGKFNFKLWEEFQRWGGFPDADKTINVALTGGRKLGDVNIIVTNRVGDMLANDRFGVFSNVTSVAIGAIGDANVRADLCERLSIPQMLPELDTIDAKSKNLDVYIDGDTLSGNKYAKSFLIGLDKAVYTISRMEIPKELSSSKLFRTGVNIKKGREEQ